MNKAATTLADICEIRTRYRRSVHLERDAQVPGILDGYVLTPLARRTLHRIIGGLLADNGQRAWTLTGPYGSGKSAFEVFLFALLSKRNEAVHQRARQLLRESEETLAKALLSPRALVGRGGLLPVLLTGERGRLDDAIVRALERAVTDFWSGPGARADIVSRIQAAARGIVQGKRLSASEIVALVEETAAKVARSMNAGAGLLLVVDELGKFLEHAALVPSDGDVYLLQLLAEAANRSGDAPIVVVTTLHQAFERYAARLGNLQRSEWAKIQGRFEDVAFQESPEQVLQLVGAAIDFRAKASWLREHHKGVAAECSRLVANAVGVRKETLVELLTASAPLHPSTALVLGPAFRGYAAQNERSLFAFLASREPFGFQAFLQKASISDRSVGTYRISDLHDYLAANLGSALDAGAQGRRWSTIEEALTRLGKDSRPLDAAVVKTIGVLNALGGSTPAIASNEFLQFALDGFQQASKKDVADAIKRLQRYSSIVYRKYKDAFQLWDGSDLDVEALMEDAAGKVDGAADLAAELERLHPARPLVAKRHLFKTGTLRYFDVRYVNARDIHSADELLPEKAAADADGLLVYVIPSSTEEAQTIRRAVSKPQFWFGSQQIHRRPLILAIPDEAAPMRESLIELAALEKVRAETVGLESDPIARRELAARGSEARQHLHQQAEAMFGLARREATARCAFFVNSDGEAERREQRFSARELSDLASRLCDAAYAHAPRIHNELINRRQLSSAAASARRLLLEVMLSRAAEPDLGFSEGAPPERAMYRAVLVEHGLHRMVDGKLQLSSPPDMKQGLGPVWRHVEEIFSTRDGQRIPVAELFTELERPPFGLKAGVLPIVLTAILVDMDSEVALYEEGAFVPRLTAAVIERLVRNPRIFEVQRSRIDGARAQVFERFADAFVAQPGKSSKNQLVKVVKQLATLIAGCPPFALLTKRLPPRTVAVRDALVRAKEPAQLLFSTLPQACGLDAFDPAARTSERSVDEYFRALRTALDEIEASFPALLKECQAWMSTSFGLSADATSFRKDLRSRAAAVSSLAVEPKLKSFLLRASEEALEDEEWLTSLLTSISGKPPAQWADPDVDAFQAHLALLTEKFRTFEALAFSLRGQVGGDASDDALRVALARLGGTERSLVVRVARESKEAVMRAEAMIEQVLADAGISHDNELALAALARVAERFLHPKRRAEMTDA
ncbi:MAG: hypothetical protein IT383_27370 [Deltaproteobacteria bacterium]|nr:hypothetical protein [Deltaproteobacteria bacterium]